MKGERKRKETQSEGQTADWTHGFGKFEALFTEQFPAVNLQCLCEPLLKRNPLARPRSFISTGLRGGFFS